MVTPTGVGICQLWEQEGRTQGKEERMKESPLLSPAKTCLLCSRDRRGLQRHRRSGQRQGHRIIKATDNVGPYNNSRYLGSILLATEKSSHVFIHSSAYLRVCSLKQKNGIVRSDCQEDPFFCCWELGQWRKQRGLPGMQPLQDASLAGSGHAAFPAPDPSGHTNLFFTLRSCQARAPPLLCPPSLSFFRPSSQKPSSLPLPHFLTPTSSCLSPSTCSELPILSIFMHLATVCTLWEDALPEGNEHIHLARCYVLGSGIGPGT